MRTNNDVEGWHRRLNGHAKKGQLPFYVLVALPHEEARFKLVSPEVHLVKEARLQRYQRRVYRSMQGRLFTL